MNAERECCNAEDRFAVAVLDTKVPRQTSKSMPFSFSVAPSPDAKTVLTNLNNPTRGLIYFVIMPNDHQNNFF